MSKVAKIKGHLHEPLIRRFIAAGWSSVAISLYMMSRFGYEVHDSTIRVYRLAEKDSIREEWPELEAAQVQTVFKEKVLNADDAIDVLGRLASIIRLQEARIMIDVTHEEQMGKLFGSTKHEIKVYGDMLRQYHEAMQDWGIVPRAGAEITVRFGLDEPEVQPVMLIDVIEEEDVETAAQFGRLVASKAKMLGNGSTNGHKES